MQESKEPKWSNRLRWSDRDIKHVCFQKIALVRTRRRHLIDILLPNLHLPARQMQLKWLPLALLLPVLESCQLDGSRGILQKVEHTLSIIILELPHGSTRGDNNTSGCTVKMLVLETAPFNNNQYHSLDPCLVGGRCGSLILHVCTLLTTIPRQRLGTIHDYLLRWTRTSRNTSVISGES